MKKHTLFFLSITVFISCNLIVTAFAEDKGTGSNVFSRMTGVDPNIKATPTPSATPTPTPTATPYLLGNPLDKKLVSRNQQKDNLLANGIQFYNAKKYDAAIQEFAKANSISFDRVTKRWKEVSENRKERKRIMDIIEKMEAKKAAKLPK